MKTIPVYTFILCLLCFPTVNHAQVSPSVVVVPMFSETEISEPMSKTIVSRSGVWLSAGLAIPSMIIHDLFIYVDTLTSANCMFSMNYVLNNIQSRTIRRFTLFQNGSVQLNFSEGVNSSDLRFGTVGGSQCVRNWTAFGVQAP